MILGPTKDYSKDEAQKVIDYLNAGGKAIIACEAYKSAQTDKPNFESILEAFGVKVVDGVVAENDINFYSSQYGPFFTFANGSGSFASGIDNYIIAPYAKGLQQANKDDSSITYTSLATTSKAVSKTHLKSAKKYTKEDGDVEGTFDLGAQIKKSVTSENENGESTTTETNILALSSVYMLDDNMNELVADANLEMFNNALSEYINTDDSVETLSIPSKSLQASQLTILDYNRVVTDLNGYSSEDFLKALEKNFIVENKGTDLYKPTALHNFSMYLDGNWYSLTAKRYL